jgi:hypothetical protein
MPVPIFGPSGWGFEWRCRLGNAVAMVALALALCRGIYGAGDLQWKPSISTYAVFLQRSIRQAGRAVGPSRILVATRRLTA